MSIPKNLNVQSVDILGISLNRLTMTELTALAEKHIAADTQLLVGVVNVAKLVNARKDQGLRRSLDRATVRVADGTPLVWLSRLMGTTLPERLTGIDIMYRLMERASEKHYRVYFLGARSEILQRVLEFVKTNYPGVGIAGYHHGYFSAGEEKDIAEDIRESRPTILFVAMSSPKKENFLDNWFEFMQVPVSHGVGGAFDILAGETNRAPLWMQKAGLEWFYRLIQEPGRLWKRYLFTNLAFVKLSVPAVIKARLFG